jgi:hypothetical protein
LSEDSRVHPETWGPERPILSASWYPRPLRQHWWLISFQFLATETIPVAGQAWMRACVRIFTHCSVMPKTFQYSVYPLLALLRTQYISIRSYMNYLNNIHIAFFTRTPQIRPRFKYLTRSSSKEHTAVHAASRPPWIMGTQCIYKYLVWQRGLLCFVNKNIIYKHTWQQDLKSSNLNHNWRVSSSGMRCRAVWWKFPWRFGGMPCLHLQGRRVSRASKQANSNQQSTCLLLAQVTFRPDDGGSTFLRNVATLVSDYPASHLKI